MKFLRKIIDIFFPPSPTEIMLVKQSREHTLPFASLVPHKHMYAVFHYRYPVIRSAIRILKRHHNNNIATCFGNHLYEHIQSILDDEIVHHNYHCIICIPMPITPTRLRERGFNQATLITQAVVKKDVRYQYKEILIKQHDTEKQAVQSSRHARARNMKNCFTTNPQYFPEKNTLYVVIDDVITTGATMKEALRTLRIAGYKNCIGIAVAH